MPLIEIADINRDGMMDLAFMTDDGKLTILYNQYESADHNDDNLCKKVGNTKRLAEKSFFGTFPFEQKEDVVQLQSPSANPPTDLPKLVGLKESMPGIPGRVRFADMDADGYPDAMLTLEYSSEDGT